MSLMKCFVGPVERIIEVEALLVACIGPICEQKLAKKCDLQGYGHTHGARQAGWYLQSQVLVLRFRNNQYNSVILDTPYNPLGIYCSKKCHSYWMKGSKHQRPPRSRPPKKKATVWPANFHSPFFYFQGHHSPLNFSSSPASEPLYGSLPFRHTPPPFSHTRILLMRMLYRY